MNISSEQQRRDELILASLFEKDFSIDWLLEISDTKASQILGCLESEVEKGTLLSKGQGWFVFQDQKRKQELFGCLTALERESYHRKIAAVIQRDFSDDDAVALEIASHLINTSNNIESCQWLFKAAEVQQNAHHPELAFKYYLKIVEDLSQSEEDEANALFIDTAISISKNSAVFIKPGAVIAILENALLRAKKRNDEKLMIQLELHIAKNEWVRGNTSLAYSRYINGLSLADYIADEDLHNSIMLFKVWFNFWFGRYAEAVREYKKYIPDIDQYPTSQFPILTSIVVGDCLIFSGQYSEGLGLLNALYDHCQKIGDMQNAAMAELGLGYGFVGIRMPEEALPHLANALSLADRINNNWVKNHGYQYMGYLYYLTGEIGQSEEWIRKWQESARNWGMPDELLPNCMEILWAAKKGQYPSIPGLELEKQIDSALKAQSPFAKGVAYRYLALLQQSQGETKIVIRKSFDSSIQYLKESGCPFELALTGMEMSRYYRKLGIHEKAVEWITYANGLLPPSHKSIIPDDLQNLVRKKASEESLLKKIMVLCQEIVSLRENREVVNNILATARNITGAERAAIFMLDLKKTPLHLYLRAARNLTAEDVEDKSFEPVMALIREAVDCNQGNIHTYPNQIDNGNSSRNNIKSCICVPMANRGDVVGALYLDNRLLDLSFSESDMEMLFLFAALAAISLDNAEAYAEIKEMSRRLEEEKKYYEEQQFEYAYTEEIIGKSDAVKKVLAHVDKVAKSDTTVLILGETGVGKELVASAIHRHGLRADKPFIRVNCSALSESLINSELFGHEKGAFTGAINRRMGRFELANGGTLFLDEIGELPMEVQVRLLRIIQTKQFERVGGTQTLKSDFRLIVATNRNLAEEVLYKRFRQDLFYRINVFPIEVPPLRSRIEDIPLLAYYFLKTDSEKMRKSVTKIPQSVMDKLISYSWPGNVRELENVIERGVILSPDSVFRMPELEADKVKIQAAGESILTFEENERSLILNALKLTGGKINGKGGVADLLKINRNTLYYRMKKLGIKK